MKFGRGGLLGHTDAIPWFKNSTLSMDIYTGTHVHKFQRQIKAICRSPFFPTALYRFTGTRLSWRFLGMAMSCEVEQFTYLGIRLSSSI